MMSTDNYGLMSTQERLSFVRDRIVTAPGRQEIAAAFDLGVKSELALMALTCRLLRVSDEPVEDAALEHEVVSHPTIKVRDLRVRAYYLIEQAYVLMVKGLLADLDAWSLEAVHNRAIDLGNDSLKTWDEDGLLDRAIDHCDSPGGWVFMNARAYARYRRLNTDHRMHHGEGKLELVGDRNILKTGLLAWYRGFNIVVNRVVPSEDIYVTERAGEVSFGLELTSEDIPPVEVGWAAKLKAQANLTGAVYHYGCR